METFQAALSISVLGSVPVMSRPMLALAEPEM